ARNIRFATLSTGDVAAVFLVHDPDDLGLTTSDDRVVFAAVYSASSNSWGAATQLGTADATTDVAEDYDVGNWNTPFCAPAIAAGPDGSAMVLWCETVGTEARVFYSQYTLGAWSAAAQLITAASNVAFPGYSGYYHTFNGVVNTTTIQDGDTFTVSFDNTTEGNIGNANCIADYTMTAASTEPATENEFKIYKKADGTVLVCDTMREALNRVLFADADDPLDTLTLHQCGVSTWINPGCVDTDTATWDFAVRYNQSLAAKYRTIGEADDNSVLAVADTFGNMPIDAGTLQTNVAPYSRAAVVDVAADGYGNYLAVRSVVAPYFDDNIGSTVGNGRQLVGHVYLASSGWVYRSGGTDPEAYLISRTPACYTGRTATSGATYVACSVRQPKALMSENGHGLVLYYQNQRDTVSSTVATSSDSFPNRLWYSTYSVATGFTGASATVDSDVLCDSNSIRNDRSVCEGGSSGVACQLEREPEELPLDELWVDSSLPPIAADMNASGSAVIAYHKDYYLSDGTCSALIGVHVALYDPVNGLGSVKQLDDGTGNTMNAAVTITESGKAAVVWEQIVSGVRYVYLRSYENGTWSVQEHINSGLTATSDAASPAVKML
ncbi:MAG TPA: hypothetical protein PLH57_09755, partial [Oligoflexia bacterium]|nr:hypothetical protein [Oligoflexia bacterium]